MVRAAKSILTVEFVRTDKEPKDSTTHIYRKVEKPVKKVTAIWVTEGGFWNLALMKWTAKAILTVMNLFIYR